MSILCNSFFNHQLLFCFYSYLVEFRNFVHFFFFVLEGCKSSTLFPVYLRYRVLWVARITIFVFLSLLFSHQAGETRGQASQNLYIYKPHRTTPMTRIRKNEWTYYTRTVSGSHPNLSLTRTSRSPERYVHVWLFIYRSLYILANKIRNNN